MAIYYTISGTVTELITLEEAKMQLRIDAITDHEDSLIESYISEAREIAEGYIGRLIGERNLEIKAPDFVRDIEKVYSPVNSISAIKYYDATGDEQTLPTAKYQLLLNVNGDNTIRYDADIPTVSSTKFPAVTITAKVGYNATNCPKSIIAAIKLILTRLYNFREDSPEEKQQASRNILRRFKKWA